MDAAVVIGNVEKWITGSDEGRFPQQACDLKWLRRPLEATMKFFHPPSETPLALCKNGG
jgi:hypothetical protein